MKGLCEIRNTVSGEILQVFVLCIGSEDGTPKFKLHKPGFITFLKRYMEGLPKHKVTARDVKLDLVHLFTHSTKRPTHTHRNYLSCEKGNLLGFGHSEFADLRV